MDERPISDYTFEQFLNEEKLMGSKCLPCDRIFVPPRALCPQCHRLETEWSEMQGRGVLVAFTSISVGPPLMHKEGHNRKNPYCSGVVELTEGPRVVGRIEGIDALNPINIKIGIPLKVKFLHRGANENPNTVLAFTLL